VNRIRGVVAAVATPVDDDFAPDVDRLVAHSRWLLANGCDGLNVLGTTGGFASFSAAQRVRVMRALAESGLPLGTMMVGTGTAAFEDTVALTNTAVETGFAGALVIPPFYYKNVTGDGVFAYFARVIDAVGEARLRLYLYNFPAMSGVPFTVPLVARLVEAYPGVVVGLKDSSNDAAYVAALHEAFPDLDVFPSSESVLANARRAGYAGCISATANVTSALAARVWSGDDDVQPALAAIREAIASVPLIAACHHLVGEMHGDPAWRRVPPPLYPLDEREIARLHGALAPSAFGRYADALSTRAARSGA
jgi:4-hydroxy-tetrahydrodipicolinate synthase